MTQYTIKPQAGYIVVEPISSEDFNKTEIATIENERERIATGKVISVSEFAGVFENFAFQFPSEVKVDDVIAYIQYTEHPLKVNGKEYHLVRADKVTAIIEEVK